MIGAGTEASGAQAAARGTIKGHIKLNGQLPGNPVIRMGVDPMCAKINAGKRVIQETVVASLDGSLANAFVYLDGTFPATAVPTEPVTLDQQSCIYRPRVIGLRVGQTLQVKNSDALLHNVHGISVHPDGSFNVGQPLAGMVNKFTLKNEEIMFQLKCDIHRWMIAYIGVVNHPYFAVSDTAGTFEIRNVPARHADRQGVARAVRDTDPNGCCEGWRHYVGRFHLLGNRAAAALITPKFWHFHILRSSNPHVLRSRRSQFEVYIAAMAAPNRPHRSTPWSRRAFLATALGTTVSLRTRFARTTAAGAGLAGPRAARLVRTDPLQYPDPDIVALDPRFRRYMVANTDQAAAHRHAVGRRVGVERRRDDIWSGATSRTTCRCAGSKTTAASRRSATRRAYSNGNTFDYEGRQLSCEHGGRRVVRYEPNGTVTVIADKFQGKRLNSPNDIVVHPDGGIWFTDPIYGIRGNYEGFKGEPETQGSGVPRRSEDRADRQGDRRGRRSPTGSAFRPTTRSCTSPTPARRATIKVWDVDGKTLRNGKRFVAARHPGHRRALGGRRHPLRRRRQRLGGRAARRADHRAERRAHRHDSPAGDLRQRLLRRREAEPAVHGRQPVAVRGLRRDDGRAHR